VREPELAELRAFCAAATLGSIAGAARSLNVSQPALSKRLRTLEAVAGRALFERTSRGVTLTLAGTHLYRAARRLLDDADSIQVLMQNPAVATPVRMACSPAAVEGRLTPVLVDLAQVEPGLSVELITANSGLARQLVREGRSDLAIAARDANRVPAEGVMEKVIWRDEIVVAVPPGHAWLSFDEIPPAALSATPVLQRDPSSHASQLVTAALERLGLSPARPEAAIGSTTVLVARSLAAGIPALLPLVTVREYASLGLEVRRVQGLRFERDFALVWSGVLSDLPRSVQVVAEYILDLPFARSRRAGRPYRDA